MTIAPDMRGARLCIVSPMHPLRGGIAQHSACLARALADAGADVRVIGYRRLYPRALFPGTSERDDASLRPIDAPHTEACLVPWDARTWARALARIDAHAPDLVVVAWWHSFMLPHTVALLSALRARGRRTLLLCHNVESHELGALDAAAWSVLSRLPSAFLVHGSHQAERLRRRVPGGARAVHVVPHPAYEVFAELSHAHDTSATAARARLGLAPDDEVVLLFGLVRRYKGLALALQAFDDVARRRPRAVLVIAGEPYEAIGARARAHTRVVVHDRFIRNEEVADYFRAADVLFAPYQAGQSHSGVVQIARAFGLPVVGTPTDGLRELVEHERTGLLAPPEGLASALMRVLEDAALRARLAAAMRESAARYRWSALADAVLAEAARAR